MEPVFQGVEFSDIYPIFGRNKIKDETEAVVEVVGKIQHLG